MEILSWEKARSELDAIDPALCAAFDAVYRCADGERQHSLTVARASYAYGADVMRWGSAMADTGGAMPETFILPTSLPLGIIVRNGMEVSEAGVSRAADGKSVETRFMPQALLGVRRLVGVFELLDWKTGSSTNKRADWNITAGSRTIYTTERYSTASAAKSVRQNFGVEPRNASTLHEWLKEIPAFAKEVSPSWRTNVLYFSRSWFEDAVRLDGRTPTRITAAPRELYHQLLELAWPTLSRLRPNSAMLKDLLREVDDRKNPDLIEAAFQLLNQWTSIRAGLQPCFAPTAEDDDLGPFATIVEKFLRPLLGCDTVLRPTYLGPKQPVGYLKLSQVAPVLFARQIENNLRLTMRLIRMALRRAEEMKKADEAAARALNGPETLNGLTFRIPSSDPKDRNARVLRFTQDGQAGNSDWIAVGQEEFFSCYSGRVQPKQRCEFFTASLRIDLAHG